jgi:predicted transcriptional regulator
MAVYGAAFFGAARLDAAVAELDRPSLRRGRYAAAQLWKVTTVGGRHLDLGELLAPFLGDVEAVVPYPLIQVFRHLDSFRMPTREHNGIVCVPAWAEEVRGMPVRYLQAGTMREHVGRMPARATRRGYVDVRIEVPIDPLFTTAWRQRFAAEWPIVYINDEYAVHPALDRLAERTAAAHFAIRNNTLNQRNRVVARRRRMAQELGLRVDENGLLIPDEEDSE